MRPAYLIALLVALVVVFWSTGRADTALAPWGLNVSTCYQRASGGDTFYCGKAADQIEQRREAAVRSGEVPNDPSQNPYLVTGRP